MASQSTQACGDQLIIIGTSEGTVEGTRDTQTGSHEMIATGVKRKAVGPAASAGLPLARRREEEAGVGIDDVPNALDLTVDTMENIRQSGQFT